MRYMGADWARDMAEPLKNVFFTPDFIRRLGERITAHYPEFDTPRFQKLVLDEPWAGLELKERMRKVSVSLGKTLPSGYEHALNILRGVGPSFSGFDAMVFPDFVECFGLRHWSISMAALKEFTRLCSSEFAVRPFIDADPVRAFESLAEWARDEDEMVRRLASEGCRPRLPWAMALPKLKQDPTPILPILEKLKDDASESVRRSVANNLNDISKDHPDLVLDVCERWQGSSADSDRIIKHACRTLLKSGNTRAMRLFGFGDPTHLHVKDLAVGAPGMRVGDETHLSFTLLIDEKEPVRVRLEYAMDFVRPKGKKSRKVFQIREGEFAPGRHAVRRKISLEDRSTRKHHPGEHRLTIIVNGVEKGNVGFLVEAG